MKSISSVHIGAATFGLCVASTAVFAHEAPANSFTPEQISKGAKIYANNCSVCHGPNMVEPGGGFFDLRTFPPAQRSRFTNSVNNGKNSMPPWRSVLSREDIDNLFAYVVAGEKKN